jgi:holo-[acyl-carrier protein] synthase
MNIGVDIEEIKRFDKYVNNEEYLKNIFSQEEILYSIPKKNAIQHLAVRFAAKEAVWKALSTRNKKLVITDISVRNDESGKPRVYIRNKECKKIDISLSHTKDYVVAVAIAL